MKKFKITDGYVKKLEKRLTKIVKEQYGGGDGLYCEIQNVEFVRFTDTVEITVSFGRDNKEEVDGFHNFYEEIILSVGDGKIDFLAGQFYQALLDGNK